MKVTDTARATLYNMIMARGSGEVSLRLAVSPSKKLGLVLDKQSEGDRVIEYNGVKVLLVSEDIEPLLENVTLDATCKEGKSVLTMNKA